MQFINLKEGALHGAPPRGRKLKRKSAAQATEMWKKKTKYAKREAKWVKNSGCPGYFSNSFFVTAPTY